MADVELLTAKVGTFRELHAGPEMLTMANAWDAASAQRFEAAGFPAIATTSGGVALALGYADHEQAPVDEMLAAAARIVRAVALPVTVDLEAGYGLGPEEIARCLVDIGAVGLNLEDTDHRRNALVPAEAQAERLAAVKGTARSLGVDLFLNARVDVFIRREGDLEAQVAEGARRGRLYREAGADCVYPIMLGEPSAIRAMVNACGVVNVTVRRGGPLSLDAAAAAGARRVTYATSLFRDTMNALDLIAAEIRAAAPGKRAGSKPE
ncbi:MAG: isocitrate lyase/phosphoenolpyruvate mutase family protein [Dehalococcoidia bacterium]|nr:isocitrate lyase/phosphoenolpyruvate mutase family protein [Dehalococcoidia bacterium]